MELSIKEKAAKAYREKCDITETDSGIPLKNCYTVDDIDPDKLEKKCPLPGTFPYTRGIYENMYRGRLWSRRELCGYASPEVTNERIKFLIDSGESAINFIVDVPTHQGIDSDHPRAKHDIGRQGVPLCTIEDAEHIIKDIPLDKISVNVTTLGVVQPAIYFAAAKKAGFKLESLMGTCVNENLHYGVCGFNPPSFPLTWGWRCCLDFIEFCMKEVPKFNPLSIDVYDYRENGITAPMEVAFAMTTAREYLNALLQRGLDIEKIAPKIATITHSSEINFFEEIAKLRAARRIWANMLKDEFKATSERALRYKFHVHTAGNSLTMQQPLVNTVRIAYEALAAVLGGCQSLHTCSYDEAQGLPTEESHELAIRTQQVLTYETGVTSVADPLGGSYFVEALTDEIESKILEYMEKIEEAGGMRKAVMSGWVDAEIGHVQYEKQKDIESGKKPVIGLNKFRKPMEEEKIMPAHEVPDEMIKKHLENLKKFKQNRNKKMVSESLEQMYLNAKDPNINLGHSAIEAAEAGATMAEMRGTIRLAHNDGFDPFSQVEPEFDASFATE